MGSRNRLTPQWAADINASDPHDPESLAITQEYEALFRKEPLEALKHLRTLYELRDRCRLDIRLNNMCLVFAEELENGARMPSVAANLTMKTLVSAGLTELYFDMILEDDFFQEFSIWINNVFSGIFQIIQWSHTVKEERIAKIFIDKGPALWNHIWNSKDLLVRSDQLEIFDAKVREGLADLSLQYQILYYEKNAFPMLADSRVAHVGMLVWIHMEPDNPRSELFLRTVMVFTRHTRSIPEVLAFVKEAAINTVGPVRFLRRLHRALELESKIDKDLQSIVGAMAEYLHHPDVRSLLGTSGTHKALMNAVARQEKRGLQSFRFPITISAIRLLAGITQSTPLEIGAEPLLREHDMIGFIARSVVFCARKSCQEWEYFYSIAGIYRQIASKLKNRGGRNSLFQVYKSATRREWYPALKTLHEMQSRTPSPQPNGPLNKLTTCWTEFGVEVGMDEEVERERYERKEKDPGKFCSWRECQFHTEKSGKPMRACVGCQEARYCDRACQMKDWKEGGHKARCRRLKG